jgi:transketolase
MFTVIYNGEYEKVLLRDVFASTMEKLFKLDDQIVYLDADLMNAFSTLQLSKDYPEKAIDCGVQEANMIGIAAGMSAVGRKPYVHTFAAFASRRCFDQVFLSVGYSKNSVRIIGSDAGVTAAYNGGTHMPFEDVAMYRTIPGAAVFDIVDSVQFENVLMNTKDRPGVTYIRTIRKKAVGVYGPGSEFEIGKANVLRDGSDVTIIACGIMVAEALKAAQILEEQGISAAVIDIVTIKPVDEQTVIEYAKKTGAVVTAENANIIGGLGSAVAEVLSRKQPTKMGFVGINDLYGEVGEEEYLRQRFELTPEKIVKVVKDTVK